MQAHSPTKRFCRLKKCGRCIWHADTPSTWIKGSSSRIHTIAVVNQSYAEKVLELRSSLLCRRRNRSILVGGIVTLFEVAGWAWWSRLCIDVDRVGLLQTSLKVGVWYAGKWSIKGWKYLYSTDRVTQPSCRHFDACSCGLRIIKVYFVPSSDILTIPLGIQNVISCVWIWMSGWFKQGL